MKVLNSKEVLTKFDLSEEELDSLENDASQGRFHGEPNGPVIMGRPPLYGEPMVNVGFKESRRTVRAMDERARQLGCSRSTYLRQLVEADLRLAGTA